MKILWFTNTPSLYDQGKHSYHGGGWIESLEEILKKENSIELGISFFHKTDKEKISKGGTTYYPVLRKSAKKNPVKFILNTWSGKLETEAVVIPKLLKVIEDFEPDVIHVFGSEEIFASIQTYTTIPVVIHLQGLINPCVNAYFSPGQSKCSMLLSSAFILKNIIGFGFSTGLKRFNNQAKREAINLRNAKFVMGRTEWDKKIANIYNPNVKYFHIDEVLRPIFYRTEVPKRIQTDKIILISTLSPTIYKGIDVILKTASLLKNETNINFEWRIIGLDRTNKLLRYFISSTKIDPEQVNLKFLGKKNAEELVKLLNEAAVFIHPSYIDNSPNSVCEAQILGLPIIACNVGGLSSLINDRETGILTPSNGIFEIVSSIAELVVNQELWNSISQNAKLKAHQRHNQTKIINELIGAYKMIKDS